MSKAVVRSALAAMLLMAAGSLAFAKDAVPYATIPLKQYIGTFSTFEATVDGKTGTFLFDTGGGITVVSPDFLKAIGCKVWGRVSGFRMTGERLDGAHCDGKQLTAGGKTFDAPVLMEFDIMKLLSSSLPHVDGSAGMDIFAGKVISIVPQTAIVVESPESLKARIGHTPAFPIRIVRDAEGVALAANAAVKTPDGTAWMELDTSNSGAFVISNHIAPLVDLKADDKDGAPAKIELANGIVLEGKARTRDLIMDGNIGAGVLSHYVLTLDLAGARAWLTPLPAKPAN